MITRQMASCKGTKNLKLWKLVISQYTYSKNTCILLCLGWDRTLYKIFLLKKGYIEFPEH